MHISFRLSQVSLSRVLYIGVNLLVSGLGFIRSFIFMKYLNFYELGMLTVIQTIMMLIPLFQFGLINGGYRIIAIGNNNDNEEINNLLFTFFGIVTIILIVVWIGSLFFDTNFSSILLLLAFVIGSISLIVNWITNVLIGRQLLNHLNQLNLIAALCSLALLPSVIRFKLFGAIILLLAHPLIFVITSMIKYEYLRPTKIFIDFYLVKRILYYGFIPFLAGIFGLINIQIERWTILKFLGAEELGRLYLVFLYSTLFLLIPNSILNLFFPQCIQKYENKEMLFFRNTIKNYLVIIFGYQVLIFGVSVLFLKYFILIFLPNHVDSIKYVFLYLPGLLSACSCGVFALIYNSSVKLKPILYAESTSIVVNLILIFFIQRTQGLSLLIMVIIKSCISIYILLFYIVSLFFLKKNIFKSYITT